MNPEVCAALEKVEVVKSRRSLLQIDKLHFRAGEITAIIGPNGAGKSTLLKVLHGLEKPTAGTVCFRGQSLGGRDLLELRRRMAMVFQSPCLFQTTVYENIAAGLRIRKFRRSEIDPIVRRWAARFGVEPLLERQARHLSGGEAQRVALARALACGPELFLLDEPFASLDPPTREALCRELRAVIKEEGITAVVVTHVMEEVFLLADRAVMLSAGRVVQDGTPEELLARPANSEVADFVGKRRILLGRVVARTGEMVEVATPEGRFRLPAAAGGEGTFLLCLREGE
ncbi:abc transporter, ATP-binding protein [Heliomicrobium modesticaldum Ice1]|uniref:Abc transporter, ATP-binding protein n=1 Tax=Heliobacterium modesticaldum (strain ATCC 51547 / Ice1) TaxID=498761 RepID=B0TEX1_HELMI|nr:ABC transporter ATP-binding protein [Heliomicrobium modesticaldum]ABZ82954.1 abc transporter, ATP-binding protein [Heliomicrobium modesticaldum Ice1]